MCSQSSRVPTGITCTFQAISRPRLVILTAFQPLVVAAPNDCVGNPLTFVHGLGEVVCPPRLLDLCAGSFSLLLRDAGLFPRWTHLAARRLRLVAGSIDLFASRSRLAVCSSGLLLFKIGREDGHSDSQQRDEQQRDVHN
jgi:hypothetical protein